MPHKAAQAETTVSQTLNYLEKRFNRLAQLEHAMTFLGWDQMVIMPDKGATPRSNAIAELASLHHELLVCDSVADALREVEGELKRGDVAQENARHIEQMMQTWQRAQALPADLVHAKVVAGSKCEHAWRTQKTNNDWSGFLVNFEPVVQLAREEAQLRQAQRPQEFATPYDALLDLHCSGDSQALISEVFAQLKQALPNLLERVIEKQQSQSVKSLEGEYPQAEQHALNEHLMRILGFDFDAGRLDVSLHPFSTGVRGDQRITTRYRSTDFADALQATAHETGHASYEAGLPERWQSYPVGRARNMCIHESQSLFFEKQVFLSRAFGQSFLPSLHQHLPATQQFTADDIWQAQTRVQPSFIRVEADEVTYPLHVMLRYDIESELINGNIEAHMIPQLWESSLHDYLGLSTNGDHAIGCLQDIHWTDGAFGYFPSYTMGAVNAAQLSSALKTQHPDWREQFAKGELAFAREWLADNIWQFGRQMSSQELMQRASGQGSNAQFLLSHLESRYLNQED